MSDTGSINFVLSQRLHPQERDDSAPIVRILDLPDSPDKQVRTQKIRGEVIRKDNDGTINIKTEQGTVRVRAEGSQPIKVKEGDIVEIRIDRNTSEQTATIYPAPALVTPQFQTYNVNINNVSLPTLEILKTLITNGMPIQVTPITPQAVVQPFIDIISTGVPHELALALGNVLATPPPILPAQPITEPAAPLETANPILLSQPSLLNDTIFPAARDITDVTRLNFIQTEIPLAKIMAQIISKSPESLIRTPLDDGTAPPLTPGIISEIVVLSAEDKASITIRTEQAEAETKASDTPSRTEGKAGETRAEIAGFTIDRNFPVLKLITPDNRNGEHYALNIPVADATLNTELTLHIKQSSSAPVQPIIQAPMPLSYPPINSTYFLTPEIWTSLNEAQNVIAQHNPQAVQTLNNVIPNAGAPMQFGTTALFFFAAVRGGDIQNWLGDKVVDSLRRAGKSDLLTRLGQEFSGLSRLNAESTSQEWRSLALPLAWQNEIHKVVLHYRKEGGEQNGGSETKGGTTRFVLNLSLGNIGKAQADGLFQEHKNNNSSGRLDLVLRTEQGFSQNVQAHLRSLYKDALNESNIAGELSFQESAEYWVHIAPSEKTDFLRDI